MILQQNQWDIPEVRPANPEVWEYGYICGRRAFASTREGLIGLVQGGNDLSFVWTPDSPEPVSPETVPFLLDALRTNHRKAARTAIYGGLGFVGAAILIALIAHEWRLIYRNLFFVLGAVFLPEGIWSYWRASHYTQSDAISDRSTARFRALLEKKNLSTYSLALLACIIIVSIVQPISENSVEIAGLVKPAVRNGEIWRLFTATLMHANITHFWMNALALIFLHHLLR